ncbi:uncharacterized protein LOC112556680 isoform X1 [Pomacea canaliculata]|uniref:uncharacterized protein LOC112556680 isoform X1 n=1 Tax=Pomacea canaliculata TaxID=400727 RepID=UPI000D73E589|nr:uncharacterized protein LOC112556680 isoform X1 [Pomacea canaliculata]XP_025081686.1 uncharacterized protein LOC112556680 isoform X1 [Pomacea canaliculata]
MCTTVANDGSYQILVVMFLLYGSHGFPIRGCHNETIFVFEDSPATFTCTNIPRNAEVRWSLGGSYVEIGVCYKNGSCQVHYPNQVHNFSRSASLTESHMTIWRDHRNYKNQSLLCHDGTRLQPDSECHLIIKSHPKLENCSITSDGFTVTGICRVTNAYSSDGTYRCIWKQNNIQQNVSYAETTELSNQTGREYLENWTCSFSQPLPRDEGIYNYTISADTFQIQGYSSTITVETPGYLSTTCPEVIEEGKSLRCQCETNRTGTPPGLVLWDGYKSDTLEIENVRLENNGSNFTCLLVWRNDTYRVLLYSLTVTQTVASTSPTGGDASASSQGFPMLLVILGAVGAVLVITVVAILVVCITRRRRGKQQDRGRMNLKGRDREEKPVNDTAPSAPTKDGQDFEDHVNVLYGGCADLRTNQSNDLAENMDATYAVVDKARLKNRLK